MLAWSENFAMGVAELDEEHRHLFKISEQILEKLRTRGHEDATRMFLVREGLNYLKGYFDGHAYREEAYMRKIGYEGYALHKVLHDDFRHIQIAKYQKIVDSGVCTKEDAWDFVGTGIGWLLEHITTADMAIVGKGVLSKPAETELDIAAVEKEVNLLLTATLNLEANARIVSTSYRGEPFGKAVYQKFVYEREGTESVVVSGIERSFLLDVATALYGAGAEHEMDLVLSTIEMFSAHFWVTLGRQLTGLSGRIDIKENHFLTGESLPRELEKMGPPVSILFTSDKGKFFVASSSQVMNQALKKLA